MGTPNCNKFSHYFEDGKIDRVRLQSAVAKGIKRYVDQLSDPPGKAKKDTEAKLEEVCQDIEQFTAVRKRTRRMNAGSKRTRDATPDRPYTSMLKNWGQGDGDPKLILATYYWLHVFPEDPFYARMIDYALFGDGVSFEQHFRCKIPGKKYVDEPSSAYFAINNIPPELTLEQWDDPYRKTHLSLLETLLGEKCLNKNDGMPSLLTACQEGHINIVRWLINNGADANLASKAGYTPLIYASANNRLSLVKWLLDVAKAKINVTSNDGLSALIAACVRRDTEAVVRKLIGAGADLNLATDEGLTALLYACEVDQISIVKLLIETKRVNLDQAEKSGNTPLMYAANKGRSLIAQLLIDEGAEVNLRNKSGSTALKWARWGKHTETEKILIEAGAKE